MSTLKQDLPTVPEDDTAYALVPLAAVSAVTTVQERYQDEFIAPVQRLNAVLTDVLDVDAHPDRDPEEAVALLKDAMNAFHEESAGWF